MPKLHLGRTIGSGKDFTLPIEMVTQSTAIIAKRRVGKSYTAAVLAEEMLKAGQQVVIVDPTGAHWGLRSSADGKSAGFPIVVIGGDHADIPLEEHGGEVLARAIVEKRFSAIIDTTLLRKGAMNRFLGAFFEALYRLNREPLCLIADEADAYAPQKPFGEEARTLGAIEDIVRRGGIRGLGTVLITQRPAVINKNVLTQCEVLVALRLVHPKDIATVMEWVNVHADVAQAAAMLKGLPSQPIGRAWFWSPGWDIFELVTVRPRETFDSGATPKPGERAVRPKVLAQIDVEQLGAEMKATAEKVKADDPKALRAEIARLQGLLKAQPTAPDPAAVENAAADGFARGQQDVLDQLKPHLDGLFDKISRHHQVITGALAKTTAHAAAAPAHTPPPRAPAQRAPSSTSAVTGGEKAILTACAQHGGCGREQLTVLTGYKKSSRDTYIQRLSSKGYVESNGGDIRATPDGLAALGNDYDPLPTGAELQRYWLDRLSGGEQELLRLLIDAYPNGVDRDTLSTTSGYKKSSRDTYLQRLGARRLVESAGRGGVIASKVLF